MNESDSESPLRGGNVRGLKRRRTEKLVARSGAGQRQAQLPAGPASYEEIFDWASFLVKSVEAYLARREVNLQPFLDAGIAKKKIIRSTTYSGMGCPEQSMKSIKKAFAEQFGIDIKYECYSAMDCNPLLRHLNPVPQHIFKDIYDLIPKKLHATLTSLQARARQKFVKSVAKQTGRKKELLGEHGLKFLLAACETLRKHTFDLSAGAHCAVHNARCPLLRCVEGSDLLIEIGGHTCTPFSSAGKRWKYLDPQALPAVVWLFWVLAKKPHIFIDECTPLFDGRLISEVLGDHYDITSMVFSPTDMGIPTSRSRRYTYAVLKSMANGAFRVDEGFLKSVALRSCDLHGSIFFRAPLQMIHDNFDRLALVRGLPARASQNSRPYKFCVVVIPGSRTRSQSYIMKAMRAGLLKDIEKNDIVVNIMQNSDFHPYLGHTIPTLMRKSQLFSLAKRRGMLPLEQMAAQGVPLFLDAAMDATSPNRESQLSSFDLDFLLSLSDGDLRHLAGNGMALSSIGTVIILALCSLPED